jgi:hypothetical protein
MTYALLVLIIVSIALNVVCLYRISILIDAIEILLDDSSPQTSDDLVALDLTRRLHALQGIKFSTVTVSSKERQVFK